MKTKRYYKLLLLFAFLLTVPVKGGETGKFTGKVIDNTTNEPIFMANVVIFERINDEGNPEKLYRVIGSTSDKDGGFLILNIPSGLYNVKCSFIGYKDETVTKVKISIDKSTSFIFSMVPTTHVTDEVVVTAFNPHKVELDLTATKQTYEIEDVKQIAGVEDLTDILQLQPDIIDNHFRGGRVGQSNYLLSGTSIVNPLTNQSAFSPIVTGMKTVEVLTSGFSAEYGQAQSGVVNMIPREGGEKWKTSLDISGYVPSYKTWGGSPYSQSNLGFYQALQNTSAWLNFNPNTNNANWYIGSGFSSYLKDPDGNTIPPFNGHNDTLKLARIAQALFLQSIRNLGLSFDNTVDSRVDFSLGGPLDNSTRLFVAGRNKTSYSIVPTAQPDMQRQVMSNLVFQPSAEDKFSFRFIWDNQFQNVFSSGSFLKWLFNTSMGASKFQQNTYQWGGDYQKILSPAYVLTLKANWLQVNTSTSSELLQDGQFGYAYSQKLNWQQYTNPANFQDNYLPLNEQNDVISNFNLQTILDAQINKTNLLKVGFQYVGNHLNIDRDINQSNSTSYRNIRFNVKPYEGGLYVQDKLEFEGLIANLGLRLDYYNMNTDYYTNLFSPTLNPNYDSTANTTPFDPNQALKQKTTLFTKLQPRMGFSFPLSESSVFHINYGTFTQRPSYDQIFWNQLTSDRHAELLGNPQLKPENTKMYDIGLVTAFPSGFNVDVSAYYKDVSDLVEAAFYKDNAGNTYQSYTNRDYSDIKGFFITLTKTDANLEVFVRYNYEAATGKSATSLDAPVIYRENSSQVVSTDIPTPADIYMNYDRTHKLVANVLYRFLDNEGFDLFGTQPLENTVFSVTVRAFSGRPYTWDINGQNLTFNQRAPWEYELRARIQKTWKFGSTQITGYAEGFNLLNSKIINYDGVFNNSTNSHYLDQYQGQFNGDISTYDQSSPYNTSQQIYVYSNQPLQIRLGAVLNF
jgi:outer membrane receptor for ferrienterochelin and colicin